MIFGNVVLYMVPVLKESNGYTLFATVKHNWAAQVVIGSYFAVDLFFVLSGFFAAIHLLFSSKLLTELAHGSLYVVSITAALIYHECTFIDFLELSLALSMVMFIQIGLKRP